MLQNNTKSKEWVLKAQNDLKSAEILFQENGPSDSICFHCHQVAEKMLKGFLIFNKKEFPKVHDLIYLLNLCEKTDKNFENLKGKISFLNRYYIETRYPSDVFIYSKEECRKSLNIAQDLFKFISSKIL